MEAKTKKIILLVGISVLVIGVGLGVYFIIKKKRENEGIDKQEKEDYKKVKVRNGSSSGSSSSNTSNSSPVKAPVIETSDPNMVNPKFNAENELSNKLSDLRGHVLYPKRKGMGGFGYANIRTSAEVNNDTNWWTDGISNLITTINTGVPIGKVISETSGLFNDYTYRWFKVKLTKPVSSFWKTYTEGYVRADVVTFASYPKPKS
jgi:hypothetical protein